MILASMNLRIQFQSRVVSGGRVNLDLDLDGSLLNACLQRAGRTKLHQHTSACRSTHPVPTHLRRLLLALPALRSDRRPPTAPSSSDSPAVRGCSCRTPIDVFDFDGPAPSLGNTPSEHVRRTPGATCLIIECSKLLFPSV